MQSTHTCEDCGSDTHEPFKLTVDHSLTDTRLVCADCNEDYMGCSSCGNEVHVDDICPLTEDEDCEYGCAKCAGYRLASYGWVKDSE